MTQLSLMMSKEDFAQVRITAATAMQRFAGCDPSYIASTCHASCCRSSTSISGTLITIHPSEESALVARGAVVIDGKLERQDGKRRCQFQDESSNLCALHNSEIKPFGCVASPFTLAKGGRTLIIRNRYRLLKCYNDGARLPAYVAFAASLRLLFGDDEANRIGAHFANCASDIMSPMRRMAWDMLTDNDRAKRS